MPIRTPDGEIYADDEVEHGESCSRCSAFIPVKDEEDLPPTDPETDWFHGTLKGYAGPRHVTESKDGFTLCPDCRDAFDDFMAGVVPEPPREPIREWVEERFSRGDGKYMGADNDEITDLIVEAVQETAAKTAREVRRQGVE